MNEIDEEVSKILVKDPIKILKKNKVYIKNLKKENERLKKQIELLMRNNKTLTELIEVIDGGIKKLTNHEKKDYVYDYEKGGWKELDSLKKENLKLSESDLNITKINLQLAEIIHLMKLHKEKNIRRE